MDKLVDTLYALWPVNKRPCFCLQGLFVGNMVFMVVGKKLASKDQFSAFRPLDKCHHIPHRWQRFCLSLGYAPKTRTWCHIDRAHRAGQEFYGEFDGGSISPVSYIFHAYPWFLGGRASPSWTNSMDMPFRRFDKGHFTIARRAIDC